MVLDYNIKDYRIERWNGFKDFYVKTMVTNDVDPASPGLKYLCEKHNLNIEQRYWIAFLYGCTYSSVTTWFIFKHFPDYSKVSIEELELFWSKNKKGLIFQSDKLKVKSFNLFIKCIQSYQKYIGQCQEAIFLKFDNPDKIENYKAIYKFCLQFYYFGRFTLFNYLDELNCLTGINIEPDTLDLEDAESSRNGLCYVCSKDNFITLKHKPSKTAIDYRYLYEQFFKLLKELKEENPDLNVNIWNLETALCAYKKLFWESRYYGYYIDRQLEEITKMQKSFPDFDFSEFYEYRKKLIPNDMLGEIQGWKGIRKQNNKIFNNTGKLK